VIPIADERPVRRVPWATLLLIATCVVVYFAVQPTGAPKLSWSGFTDSPSNEQLRFAVDNAAVPCELVKGRPLTQREFDRTFVDGHANSCGDGGGPAHDPGKAVWLGVLVTMFLHGSVPHLFGNMLFLWVFGNNVEDRQGWWRYLLLYFVGGIVATAAYVAVAPDSTVPLIGASGAIAAVMGAYFVLWPSARVKTIICFGPVLLRKVQAIWLLLVWFATQFLYVGGQSGIAWAAHVGGFAFGALVGVWWRVQGRAAEPLDPEPALAASAP
jgi:membrane associated rhomboid family serine protease